jgi:histone deacetylase complex regulatory component SIN3
VFNGTNTLWPNRYKFEVHTVAFDQTFQCGTPRQPLTIPGVSVGIAVGPCNLADGTVPYTDASNLAGQWSCASQAMGGNMFFGSADATWDFKDFK